MFSQDALNLNYLEDSPLLQNCCLLGPNTWLQKLNCTEKCKTKFMFKNR